MQSVRREQMDYFDFELEIGAANANACPVTVIRSPAPPSSCESRAQRGAHAQQVGAGLAPAQAALVFVRQARGSRAGRKRSPWRTSRSRFVAEQGRTGPSSWN